MRFLLLALLAALCAAQTEEANEVYKSVGGYDPGYSSRADAQTACEGEDMVLCSAGQLYTVVYAEDSDFADLCFSGWISDTYEGASAGWFTVGASCGQEGWNTWTPESPQNPAAHCCLSTVVATEFSMLAYQSLGGYDYATWQDAEDACKGVDEEYSLCTMDQIQGLAEAGTEMCSSGWMKSGADEYTRGWYISQKNIDDNDGEFCGALTPGAQNWVSPNGAGSAHCCLRSYLNSGYGMANSLEEAESYCGSRESTSEGYNFVVCTRGQLKMVANIEQPNICSSGYVEDGTVGWYQGDVTVEHCGNANVWNEWRSDTPSAHCCLSYVHEEEAGPYGRLPVAATWYSESPYTSGEIANQACLDAGYTGGVCTLAQQAYVEEDVNGDYGDIECVVGWVEETAGSGTYDAGYWSGCGAQDAWNNAWKPVGGNAYAHCCQSDVPEKTDFVADAYYNGNWDYGYATMEDAAKQCDTGYSLCTKNQLAEVALNGVVLSNGERQTVEDMCRLGWTADNEKGWYTGIEEGCQGKGWNTFESDVATYHCCTDFDAPPMPVDSTPVFTTAGAYAYTNEASALDGCQALNEEYSLCSQAEITKAAIDGVDGEGDTWGAVEPQHNLCYSAYIDSKRSDGETYGWYIEAGTGDCGADGWNQYMPSNGRIGAFCCYSAAFDVVTTHSPSMSTTTTKVPTPRPTDAVTSASPVTSRPSMKPITFVAGLPSSEAEPVNCAEVDWLPKGFEYTVRACISDGDVYINGRDTCIQSSDDVLASLQHAWDETWYLTKGDCTAEKTYEEGMDDQLWITNEMCDNLEEGIEKLNSNAAQSTQDWTDKIIEMVEERMVDFNSQTQDAIQDYLDKMRGI